jgi:hypothetical protein
LVFVFVSVPAKPPPPQNIYKFARAQRVGEENERQFFVFATSSRHYTVRHDGVGESYGDSSIRKKFDLRVGGQGRLQEIYFLEYEGDLVLIYEVRDGGSGWGYVERFNQRTLKVSWLAPVNSYNLTSGLIEEHSLYLAGASLVARLDLLAGKWSWEATDSLGQRTKYFMTPTLQSTSVVVRDDSGATIELDKSTGKVLKMSSEN